MSPRRHSSIPASPAPDPKGGFWRPIRTLLPYLAEFPGRVALAMACLVAAKLAGVALPLVLKRLVDGLDSAQTAVIVAPMALLAAYGILRFLNVALSELRDVVFGRVAERAMRRAALGVFRHLHALSLDFHLSRRTGGLTRDIERGVSGISFLLRFMLFNILPTILELVLVAGILFALFDWRLAAIAAVSVFIYVGFSIWITEWRTRFVREANQLDSRANTRAVDSLLNYETVKLFGNERREADEYDGFLAQWETAQQQNRLSLSALNAGQAFIVAASITLMMVLVAREVAGGAMTLGDFVAVNAYMIQLYIPLNFLGFVYREIRRAVTDMQRMFLLLDEKPRVADAPGAQVLDARRARIAFEDVRFGYGPERQILHGVSFEVPEGETVALVGPSGSGKSTIARLLFRFYDPDGGRVTINGADLRALTQESLRTHIGVVPQDTVLFNDTLYYNIAYGRQEATREAVERAAKLAHLDGFVAQLPQGWDTPVGERGLKLSGGEKQRVAIARALLKDPPVLVFDEATSSLDSASERAILEAIREVSAHRTALVIAHRLSTVVDAHQILYLERGRVLERGTHAQLLAQGGGYARLWALQQREGAVPEAVAR